MKKNIALILLLTAVLPLAMAQNDDNSQLHPKKILKMALNCQIDEDYACAATFTNGFEALADDHKTQRIKYIKDKDRAKHGIVSYEVLGWEELDNGNKIRYKVHVVYGDGNESDEYYTLIKTSLGWRFDM